MGRKPDDVKVTTSGGLSVIGEITLSSGGKTVKLGSDSTEHMLPAKRMERALSELQYALSALNLAAEDLHIVESEMIGSDASRRLVVESSAENPIETADDIESHRMQAGELAESSAGVGAIAKAIKDKAAFVARALGSVFAPELLAGDRAREKAKDKQAKLFPEGSKDDQ